MKGKLEKTEQGWMVKQEHCGINNISHYPLHPTDEIKLLVAMSDQEHPHGMGGLVDFEIVTISDKSISVEVAKLIDKNIEVRFNENGLPFVSL